MTIPLNSASPDTAFPTLGRIAKTLGDLRVRSHQTRYGAGPPPELPSRTAMIDLVDQIAAAMFPRHYGPPGLSGEGFDAFVTLSFTTALKSLQRQVQLELELGDRAAPQDDVGARALEIANTFAEALPAIRGLLETDILAAFEGDPAATSLDEVMCCYPGVAAVIRHRLAHRLYKLGVPMLARIVSEAAHSLTGIDIHPGAQIGESFFIDHGTGVVIGETAIIGKRVRLYQGVTLGARRFEQTDGGSLAKNYPRHPVLEDDVIVYAGAAILGRIVVGQGSTIAGSVWLTRSVPARSLVTQAQAPQDSRPADD